LINYWQINETASDVNLWEGKLKAEFEKSKIQKDQIWGCLVWVKIDWPKPI
jgi:hypothetical protein